MSDPKVYTVGWICAITTEYVAAQAFLDDKHDAPMTLPSTDNNHYTLGRMGKHNVVIAVLPDGEYGTSSAAVVASDMRHSFPNVRIGLMVGIAGGAWSRKHDIRLGDIVVSAPRDGKGGVIQYDFGKTTQGESFYTTGFLDQPPMVLRTAVNGLKAQYEVEGHQIETAIGDLFKKNPRLRKKYQRPDSTDDRLYRSVVVHPSDVTESCLTTCGDEPTNLVSRPERSADEDNPVIHYGLIASANQLMKDAIVRDKLAAEKDALCFEMEAAGLMNHFPCLVIRGICDYSDTHKNKEWQGYAAVAAAAYAKDLLYQIAPNKLVAQKTIADILASVQEEVGAMRNDVRDAKKAVKDLGHEQRREKIQRWLSPPDLLTNYNKALQLRQEGSGLWFLQSDAFLRWKTKGISFLWLHGIPGCGKTVLSSTIIEHLGTATLALQPLLFFYFDFNDTGKQTLDRMIRSLISQLCAQGGEGTWNELDCLYSSCEDGQRQPHCESLCKTFLRMVENMKEVWFVLDALDECCTRKGPSTEGLLLWVKSLLASEQRNVHLLVTSRREPDIESAFDEIADKNIVSIQNDLISEDIRTYVRTRVRRGAGFKRWQSRPKVRNEIETRLMEQADGMFRWAACQLDALENCLDYRILEIALKTLPKTLGETYSRILNGIPSEYKRHAMSILQFLTYSERPLTIKEAVDAIAVDIEGEQHFDPEYRMPDPREITCYCSSLVVVVSQQHYPYDESDESEMLQLAHFSVQEYLTSSPLDTDIHQIFREDVAKASIATVCLAYLLQIDQDISTDEIRETFPFAQYAARYWTDHAAVAEGKDVKLQHLIEKFFSYPGRSYMNCYTLYRPDKPWDADFNYEPASALYYASLGGLVNTVQYLLSRGTEVNVQGGDLGNALIAASYQGHTAIVQLLINKGADIESKDNYGGTPLSWAAGCGHQAIVALLLDIGANTHSKNAFSETPLSLAIENGYEAIVRFMIEKGADIKSKGDDGRTPLSWACEKGHEATVRLLLEKGADIDFKDDNGRTPLSWAAENGKKAVVGQLLEGSADIESKDDDGRTPLSWACEQGHEATVRLLLEKGADIDFKDDNGRTPLSWAAGDGSEAIVRLLLQEGAEIESKDKCGQTPLLWAAKNFRGTIIKLLLDMGTDIYPKDINDQMLISLIADHGLEAVVNLLY